MWFVFLNYRLKLIFHLQTLEHFFPALLLIFLPFPLALTAVTFPIQWGGPSRSKIREEISCSTTWHLCHPKDLTTQPPTSSRGLQASGNFWDPSQQQEAMHIQLKHSLASAASLYFSTNPIESRWISNPCKIAPVKHHKSACGVFCFFGKINRLKEYYSERWFSISGVLHCQRMVHHCFIKSSTQVAPGSLSEFAALLKELLVTRI